MRISDQQNEYGMHQGIDGWTNIPWTLTYLAPPVSAGDPVYTFTVDGDRTYVFGVGQRFKFTQDTGGVKYGILHALDYNVTEAGKTTFFLYMGTDYDMTAETISSPYYSRERFPKNFPVIRDKWSVISLGPTTDTVRNNPAASTWYNLGSLSIIIPIGVWEGYHSGVIYGAYGSGDGKLMVTLSSSNDSESNINNTWCRYENPTSANGFSFFNWYHPINEFTCSSATTMYLNESVGTVADQSTLAISSTANGVERVMIKLISSYF